MTRSLNNIKIILCFVVFISISSCSATGGNGTSDPADYPKMVERAKKHKHNLVMYAGIDTFLVTAVVVEKSRQDFTVHLNKLDSLNRAILRTGEKSKGKQFHIYMRDSTLYTLDEPHTIPFNKVARITSIN